MYLFDTDVISHLFKKKPPLGLVNRLAAVPVRDQFISTITVSEIVYGACKSARPDFHLANFQKILLAAVNVLTFDSKAAYVCGRLRARLEGEGTPLALADLEIAAIANDLTLISGNLRHFSRIPELRVENWLV